MKNLSLAAIVIAIVSLVSVFAFKPDTQTTSNVANTVLERGSIRIGYIVYPPSLIKDPNTGALSGISYDIMEKMAANLGVKTEWVEEVGWGAMIEGLRTDRYDVVGTLIWPNSSRAREAAFSAPATYSVVHAYVRANDTRFDNSLAAANDPTITLGTIDGETTTFIAKNDFPKAKTYALPQLASFSEVLTGLVDGKADMTFIEPAIAKDFLAAHPGTIKIAGPNPVRVFENVFAVKRGENDFVRLLNAALDETRRDGTVKNVVTKYNALDSFKPVTAPVGSNW